MKPESVNRRYRLFETTVFLLFPAHHDFSFLLSVYPISIAVNTVALIALYFYFKNKLENRTEQMASLKA